MFLKDPPKVPKAVRRALTMKIPETDRDPISFKVAEIFYESKVQSKLKTGGISFKYELNPKFLDDFAYLSLLQTSFN
jgi:hypothetical protein